MNRSVVILGLAALAAISAVGPAVAGNPGPAPLLGAGLPGLAVLVVAGGGYLAVRAFRRNRD